MRSAVAMRTPTPPILWAVPAPDRIFETMRQQDIVGWMRQVEEFKTASGSRCLLEHVSDADWLAHFAANEDAYSAVMAEMEKVDH